MRCDLDGLQGFDQHHYTRTVIHRLGDEAIAHFHVRAFERAKITDLHRAVTAAGCTNVNVHFAERRSLFYRFQFIEADHAGHTVHKADACPERITPEHTAVAGEAHKAVLVHVADDHADLIHMSREHDAFGILRCHGRFLADDETAHRIHTNFIGVWLHFFLDDFANSVFVSRRGIGFSECLE